jgi:hypothetical protein
MKNFIPILTISIPAERLTAKLKNKDSPNHLSFVKLSLMLYLLKAKDI